MFERDRQQPGTPQLEGTSAFLGKGCRITGKLVLEGGGRIEGHVEGEVSAQGNLVVGEGAVVNARIDGTTVLVQGQVTGDIEARERLEIRQPGRVAGNINSPSLVIQDGAIFEGKCSMGPATARLGEERDLSAILRPEKRSKDAPPKPPAELVN